MTTTTQEPENGYFAKVAAPETVGRLAGVDALYDPLTPAPRKARGIAWNCLEHVPASIASWIAECHRFGGRDRRQEAAQAAMTPSGPGTESESAAMGRGLH